MQLAGQWITEESQIESTGLAQSFKIEEKLHDEMTPYQHLEVYRTTNFGNLMVLDGVFQNTEADEFTYHEMMAHVPLFSLPNPKKVLIIGGGDGGVAREVLKHPSVEECHMVDIDAAVTKVARLYFPKIASALDNPKLKIRHEDGAKYIQQFESYFDAVIVDSSDPIGPNEVLFNVEFYKNVKRALKADGVAVAQGESMILHPKAVQSVLKKNKDIWDDVDYFWHLIPVYPAGNIGIVAMTKGTAIQVREIHSNRKKDYEAMKNEFHYYSAEIHSAAFVKPAFFHRGEGIARN